MNTVFTAACVQLCSGLEAGANVEAASRLIREAASRGAGFITTPEMTTLFEPDSDRLFRKVHTEAEDPSLAAMRGLAHELSAWLLIGSMPVRVAERRCANRSFLITPEGAIAARYDKIHMFDVDLPNGETYRESKNYAPGAQAVTAALPWGMLGLSVCYDLRFAHLFRMLAKQGASLLAIPAAFTQVTGEAHWHVLLRARAIETGCFVLAPAQSGLHESGRRTYGHSLIVDPWGEVLADAGTDPGVVVASIDMARVAEARGRIPALTHDREIFPHGTAKAD